MQGRLRETGRRFSVQVHARGRAQVRGMPQISLPPRARSWPCGAVRRTRRFLLATREIMQSFWVRGLDCIKLLSTLILATKYIFFRILRSPKFYPAQRLQMFVFRGRGRAGAEVISTGKFWEKFINPLSSFLNIYPKLPKMQIYFVLRVANVCKPFWSRNIPERCTILSLDRRR